MYILFMIATSYMAVGTSYAQSVPIPNPDWPLDSVVNSSVHFYSVQGDVNYTEPSTFVWTVDGGRLFFDQALTQMAGDGTTASVTGDAQNRTSLWVVWDSFDQPLDTGYVYLYEISSDSCQRSDADEGKYVGMRIKVSAPPKVRFLTSETLTCSNEEGVNIDLQIDGMPPYDVKYSLNGQIIDWHINPEDLYDADFDGLIDNVSIFIDDYVGTTTDLVYQLELLEASSGGVIGDILPNYSSHTVYAFVQPDAPEISPDWTQVTTGETHTYSLSNIGVNPAEWFWELQDYNGDLFFDFSSTSESSVSIPFNVQPGLYNIICYFQSENGCLSLADTLPVEVFELPTIAFADSSDDAIGCSAVSIDPDDSFEFVLDYHGALTYDFTYAIYDYNGTLIQENVLDYQTNRSLIITIPNTFYNEELPQINRTWKVVITSARNEEGVDVEVLDAGIDGGRDERKIIIHPKPIIHDDIDFAN